MAIPQCCLEKGAPMPRRITAPDRVVLLLSLVPYLTEHGETPLAELAEAFDVPERELRELIEFLGTAGIPGETNTYQHDDLFDIDWTALEEEDVVRLTRVVAVDDTPRFSASELAALIVGLNAITPLLPAGEREHARSVAEKLSSARLSVPLSIGAEREDARLQLIAEAIESGCRITFAYRSLQGAESQRTVEPLLLTQSTGGWYLRAYCLDRGAERTFIVDGIRDPRMLPEASGRRAAARASRASVIGPEDSTLIARVLVRESALSIIADFAPRVLGPDAPGWVRAEVALAYPGAAVRLVQAAPGDVVVEAPDAAREAVRAWADRALAGDRV